MTAFLRVLALGGTSQAILAITLRNFGRCSNNELNYCNGVWVRHQTKGGAPAGHHYESGWAGPLGMRAGHNCYRIHFVIRLAGRCRKILIALNLRPKNAWTTNGDTSAYDEPELTC